jgi:hypothetical protein
MSTATMSRTDATGRIRQLMDEFDTFEQEVDAKRKQFRQDMAAAEDALFGQSSNGQSAPAAAHKPAPAEKRRGRSPRPAAQRSVTSSDNRLKGSNQMSLRRAIWNVLDRNPKEWEKLLPDLPEKAEGLTIAEIREIIEKEKLWTGENIGGQLGSHLYTLKKDGLIERSSDGRYFIVEGADIDAPKGKKKKKGRK